MCNNCQAIKSELEAFFDVPFDVRYESEYQDPAYYISPSNELEELFEVKVLFRQKIRMIVEIEPQKYAASMLNAINSVDENKKRLFLSYYEQIKERSDKVEFFLNQQKQDIERVEIWNQTWKKFRIRATQIISDDLSSDKEVLCVQEWAKLSVGLVLSLLEISSIEEFKYSEGKITQVLQTKYERNPVNRELCLSANGYICKICGFDFEKVYGEIGHNFIHVHHIEMVSSFGGEYFLDPVKDMIPVCPNCHAMLHKSNPPMLPECLREIINNQKEKSHE